MGPYETIVSWFSWYAYALSITIWREEVREEES